MYGVDELTSILSNVYRRTSRGSVVWEVDATHMNDDELSVTSQYSDEIRTRITTNKNTQDMRIEFRSRSFQAVFYYHMLPTDAKANFMATWDFITATQFNAIYETALGNLTSVFQEE